MLDRDISASRKVDSETSRKVAFPINCSSRPGIRLDAQFVVDSLDDSLAGAEVPLGGLYGSVSKQKLNLLKFSTSCVAVFYRLS